MGRAPVEVWERRKDLATALVAALWTVGTAVVALIGEPVSAYVSGAAAIIGAVVTGVAAFRLWLARKRRDDLILEGQTLTGEITSMDAVNPTDIGVDPAAYTANGQAIEVPEYLWRTVDAELDEALHEAIRATGARGWIVVVVGQPKVGKSRTLFEALFRLHGHDKDLWIVAPTRGAAVRDLLERVRVPLWKRRRVQVVLWLDDLETFIDEGVGLNDLRAWRRRGAIVVATYGGRGGDRGRGRDAELGGTPFGKLMPHVRQVGLQATSPEELERLPARVSSVDREAVAEYGLAATLVAAPLLELKLKSQRHSSGEPVSPAGAAILYTAVNWQRSGRTDPISRGCLRELWPTYLPAEIAATDQAFDDGLAWASRPVAGRIALLRGIDAFRPYDYIVRFAINDPGTPRISEPTWGRALETDNPIYALSVGRAALGARRTEDAERGLIIARDRGDSQIAATASEELTELWRKRGDDDTEPDVLRDAARLGSPSAVARLDRLTELEQASAEVKGPDLQTREAIEEQLRDEGVLTDEATIKWGEDVYRDEIERGNGEAASTLGLALLDRGEHQEALEMLRKAVELGFVPAAVNLGVLLEEVGDVEAAEAAYRAAADVDLLEGALNLGLLLKDQGELMASEAALEKAASLGSGQASNNLGFLREQRGDMEGAERAYREAISRGVSAATVGLGALLESRGRLEEAQECFRQGAERGDLGAAVALARLLIEKGENGAAEEGLGLAAKSRGTDRALLYAVVLEELDDFEGAEAAYREAMERGIAVAAFNLARLLEMQGREGEAEVVYAEALELSEAEREREEEEED
jgi:tetratricopeptide (TPR) repeat protein